MKNILIVVGSVLLAGSLSVAPAMAAPECNPEFENCTPGGVGAPGPVAGVGLVALGLAAGGLVFASRSRKRNAEKS